MAKVPENIIEVKAVINILTTLLPVQKGSAIIAGHNLAKEPQEVRKSIGIHYVYNTNDLILSKKY